MVALLPLLRLRGPVPLRLRHLVRVCATLVRFVIVRSSLVCFAPRLNPTYAPTTTTLIALLRYFVSKLDIDTPVSTFIYFTYMGMISLAFFLLTGSIGFFASLWFVRKIYGAIKVD